jgi:hypothetical protein
VSGARKKNAALLRAADVAEALVKALPTLPIEQHLEVHGKIMVAMVPALKKVREEMRAECVSAVQHVPGYAALLYKEPQEMHKAIESAVRRVRC